MKANKTTIRPEIFAKETPKHGLRYGFFFHGEEYFGWKTAEAAQRHLEFEERQVAEYGHPYNPFEVR